MYLSRKSWQEKQCLSCKTSWIWTCSQIFRQFSYWESLLLLSLKQAETAEICPINNSNWNSFVSPLICHEQINNVVLFEFTNYEIITFSAQGLFQRSFFFRTSNYLEYVLLKTWIVFFRTSTFSDKSFKEKKFYFLKTVTFSNWTVFILEKTFH